MPRGEHWTVLSTSGPNIHSNPAISSRKILFNEPHNGKYILAFYTETEIAKSKHTQPDFKYVDVEVDGKGHGFLLPLFAEEMPSFRVDRMFRCHETLVAAEWRGSDAHIVTFSKAGEQWRIVDSIDSGFTSQGRGLRYGYAVDKGNAGQVVVNMGKKYCSIDKNTVPSVIQNTWNE